LSVGEDLRQAREQMGASLLDVENGTKIRIKYITAMENDAFEVLPGKVYVKGFLRSYARYLGLDGEALVSRYEEHLTPLRTEQERIVLQQPVVNSTRRLGLWKGLTAAAIAMLVIALIYLGGAMLLKPTDNVSDSGKRFGTSNPPNNAVGHQDQALDFSQDTSIQDNKKIDMVLQVTGGASWMHIIVDNKSVFEGTVGPNNVKQFAGQESIQVRFGNAGAVKVQVNGRDYGFLDGPGQVVTRTFTEKDIQNAAGG